MSVSVSSGGGTFREGRTKIENTLDLSRCSGGSIPSELGGGGGGGGGCFYCLFFIFYYYFFLIIIFLLFFFFIHISLFSFPLPLPLADTVFIAFSVLRYSLQDRVPYCISLKDLSNSSIIIIFFEVLCIWFMQVVSVVVNFIYLYKFIYFILFMELVVHG